MASAFAAGIVYVWAEAIIRLIYTYFPDVPTWFLLWPGRVGDVAAMWLAMTIVGLIVFYVLAYLVFRGRQQVWTIWGWTVTLIVSAIVAPFVAEIGQSLGV